MDKFLGQEIPEKDRWQFLQGNADAVEEIGYTHRFTPDELAQKKESLAETSIQINDIEIEVIKEIEHIPKCPRSGDINLYYIINLIREDMK